MVAAAIITARITGYDTSNILLGEKIIFIEATRRETIQKEHPVGSIAKVKTSGGTLAAIEAVTGADLEKFIESETGKRQETPFKPASTGPALTIETAQARSEPLPQPANAAPATAPGPNKPPAPAARTCPLMTKSSLTPVRCFRADCEIVISCMSAEADAIEDLGLEKEAEGLRNEIREIVKSRGV